MQPTLLLRPAKSVSQRTAKALWLLPLLRASAGCLCLLPLFLRAAALQPVTQSDNTIAPSISAGGDSGQAIATPDGRYVLFASTAMNLAPGPNTNLSWPQLPPRLNVYRRDRLTGSSALVSVNLSGVGGDADSTPAGISSDGRYALFESLSHELVPGDTVGTNLLFAFTNNVYIRDIPSGTTTAVSVTTNGLLGNGASRDAVMTPDGRYVAFVSSASDLVVGDTNGIPDVFLRDLQSGTTTIISGGASSTKLASLAYGSSESPLITPDSRDVVFMSSATNVIPGVSTAGGIYAYDQSSQNLTLVSIDAHNLYQSSYGGSNVISFSPAVSDDGTFIAYEVCSNSLSSINPGLILRYNTQTHTTDVIATNALMPASSPSGSAPQSPPAPLLSLEYTRNLDLSPDGRYVAFVGNVGNPPTTNTAVYLWDAETGSNTLVSADRISGLPAPGRCDMPVVSSNGQFVAFVSNSTNLCPNPVSPDFHLYVRDVQAGTTALVDVNTNGAGSGVSPTLAPILSPAGDWILFEASQDDVVFTNYGPAGVALHAANSQDDLVPEDRNRATDVFLRDLVAGTNELISLRNPLFPSTTPNGFSSLGAGCVSSDGRFVAFASDANNLVPNDANEAWDVFVRDQSSGSNILVSIALDGGSGSGASGQPSISADGRYVAFTSIASNLSVLDTGTFGQNLQDVFVRDLQAATTALASINMTGTGSGNGDSFSPTISTDGRFVLFHSQAQNLVPGTTRSENLYLRDLQLGATYALTTTSLNPGTPSASMTPDGRYVALVGTLTNNTVPQLYVWDSLAAAYIYTNKDISVKSVAISPNGRELAYYTTALPGAYVVDLTANTNRMISAGAATRFSDPGFSADGQFLVYSSTVSNAPGALIGRPNVYLYEVQSGNTLLVSRSFNPAKQGTEPLAASDQPAISPDGRFVAYRTSSSNAIPGDLNLASDLFLYDRWSDTTALLTPTQSGSASTTANNGSLQPEFSADSRTLVFQSWASDIASGDYNQAGDIFSLNLADWPVIGLGGPGSTNPPAFFAQFLPPGTIGPNPAVAWPLARATSYEVQFKDDLSDPFWQEVNGDPIFVGGVGYISDLTPSFQRFYRVVLHP